ncbi:MAG: tetratricopeptide repeat protein [Sphingomicrobium sp.]
MQMSLSNQLTPKGHGLRRLLITGLLSIALASCNSAQSRARDAYAEYQAAMSANDLPAGRRALQKLVAAQDDVAENWLELGKLEIQAGSYADAYHSFIRAYELDRSNPEILRIIVQIAVRGGDLPSAQRYARELAVVSPGDPWVKIAGGYNALSEHRFDDAVKASDAILAATPFDPTATVLKARGLIGQNHDADARKLLEDHVRSQPSDIGGWQLLARMYQKAGDWPRVAIAVGQVLKATPGDPDSRLLLIEAALRSGNVPLARRQSAVVLQPATELGLVSAVLDRWADHWPGEQRAEDARRLANAAAPAQKAVYAAFLNQIDRPADALSLAAPYAGLPVKAGNAEWNAVVGDALSRSGRLNEAKSRLDAVIAFDSGNATALRARAQLLLRTGKTSEAIIDAQKLVTVAPQSVRDRMLLSQCYTASGDSNQAERTLWDGFHDIEASQPLLQAIVNANAKRPDVVEQVKQEYAAQLNETLGRGLL